ncbi:hypothetical protein D5S17_31745 [Pseudonocardiaceae bacterium YIM PH 21723]|nr:hypothetical protein D5S17_31745 [Pseudonocardiaceae bacterium YIM PH 21723]
MFGPLSLSALLALTPVVADDPPEVTITLRALTDAGQCLDASHDVVRTACKPGDLAQTWTLHYLGEQSFEIRMKDEEYCLMVDEESTEDGAQLITDYCDREIKAQSFATVEGTGDNEGGSYRLKPGHSGLCLTPEKDHVAQRTCSTDQSQLWTFWLA